MFDQSTFMLESVTLAQMVEFVVEMLVDLAGGAVFDQKTAEDAEAAHPHHLAVYEEKECQRMLINLCSDRF